MPRREEGTDSYVDEWRRMWEPDLEAIAFNGTTCDPTRVHPKVLHWAKRHCARTPHFIKIINSGAAKGRPGLHRVNAACQLGVPGPFVKAYFRDLERVVTLENHEAGKTWKVSFGDASTYPQWRQGWKRVAADNNLQPGEVVVFVLVANSRFHFTRFDEHGNIINLTTNSTHTISQEKPESLLEKRGHEPATKSHQTKPESALTFGGQLKQVSEGTFKRPRLRKVGEIMSKAISNDEYCSLDLATKN